MSKDTERVDELKSMVQAWEAEQPGRTKKVRNCLVGRKAGQLVIIMCDKGMESRKKFLESQGLSKSPGEGGEGGCIKDNELCCTTK